jgi:Na+-transporting methylmalonyl-CoA/oxaloacetate decarboxylase gamma subunit
MHSRRCASSDEEGSIVLGMGVLVLVLMLAVAVGAVGAGVAGYVQAAGAADAAALAAAPVTFRQFGARGSPAQEAARFAAANGTRLIGCMCPVNRSWTTRTVTTIVARPVTILGFGRFEVRATSRATFEPAALLQP